ncbi:hypothetical protein Tco_1461727 [Tanacetum coccineum]
MTDFSLSEYLLRRCGHRGELSGYQDSATDSDYSSVDRELKHFVGCGCKPSVPLLVVSGGNVISLTRQSFESLSALSFYATVVPYRFPWTCLWPGLPSFQPSVDLCLA